MSCPTALSLRHVFGINGNVSQNGSFGEDDNVIYVAGQSVIVYNRKTRRQRYIHGLELTDVITAFSCSSGMRYAAIAEKGVDKPLIHVLDLRAFIRKKTLISNTTVGSKEFISLQFSADEHTLLSLSGGPDYTLFSWEWAKAKIVAVVTIGQPVYSCLFNPVDVAMVSVIGKDTVKFFRLVDREIRPVEETNVKDVNFLSQCWLRYPDDNLLVGTEAGEIYLFQAGEFNSIMSCSPGGDNPIMAIVSIPSGFFVGSSDGIIRYYQFHESKQLDFQKQYSLSATVSHSLCRGYINHMFLDNSEDYLGVLSSDGQLLMLSIETPSDIAHDKISFVSSEFHASRAITGLDVCIHKPLALTCSKDNTLKLWNYHHHEIEFQKVYTEEMLSVALHPSGLHCAVGFVDKLRFYHILVEDIRLCLEVPVKSCRDCKFNKSGNLLAASNGNGVLVYNFYTGEKVADLRGHNSKVRALHWLDVGCYLLSTGQDGAVYLWDVEGSKRISEFLQKGITYTSVVSSSDTVFVVGSDKCVRQLTFPDLNPQRNQEANAMLTNMSLSAAKSVLFAGTGEYGRPGNIRCYTYPFNGEFDEYSCCSSQVTRLRLTPDENFLLVADDLGCLVIYELKDRQDRLLRTNPSIERDLLQVEAWSDEILITRNELDEKANVVSELTAKVEELKLHNEYQLKLKDMSYAEKIKEATDKFVQEIEQSKTRFEILKEERNDLELEFMDRIKQSEEEHQYKVQEMETNFQAQIMELVDSYQQLMRDRDAQIERLEDQRKQLVASHERYVEELSRDYDMKLDEEKQVRQQLEEHKSDVVREIDEVQSQLEDDIDTEIENLRKYYDEKLTLSREMTLKFKGENGLMKKKRVMLQREIEDQKDEVKLLLDKEKEYFESIDMLDKEIKLHKKEIKARDLAINEKEKKIYELKKKNQELDKFKFVLDYKIRELKLRIEPRQLEIIKMKEKIASMDEELDKYHRSNKDLDELIGVLREKIEKMHEDIKEKRQSGIQYENMFSHFRNEVKLAMVFIQSPSELQAHAMKLIHQYGSNSGTMKPRLDPEVEFEYTRHKDFLAKSIHTLKKEMDLSINSHFDVNNQLMAQNLKLIEEINAQRELNRLTKSRNQADAGKIRRHAQQLIYGKTLSSGEALDDPGSGVAALDQDPSQLLERNAQRIHALRTVLAELMKRKGPTLGEDEGLPALSPRDTPFITNKQLPLSDIPSLPPIPGI